jgi:hypothetical protein
MALAWTRGEATRKEVNAARDAADAAAYAAYAAYAADAAGYAADASNAACVYAAAAAAAEAAAEAACDDAATANTDRNRVLARCADIVRAHYPEPPVIDVGNPNW